MNIFHYDYYYHKKSILEIVQTEPTPLNFEEDNKDFLTIIINDLSSRLLSRIGFDSNDYNNIEYDR